MFFFIDLSVQFMSKVKRNFSNAKFFSKAIFTVTHPNAKFSLKVVQFFSIKQFFKNSEKTFKK